MVRLYSENALVDKPVLKRIKQAVRESSLMLGKDVADFEKNFASYCGKKYCVGVGSGTDALHVALLAVGVGAGDEVITTPVTFTATSLAISHCGATPVYVDVKEDGNIDENLVELAITKKTKAILAVHLYGRPCNMKALRKIANKHKIKLIDDCAHAHGIKSLADVSCYSFYPTKNLGAWGDAGAIVTNSMEIAELAKLYKGYGEYVKNESILLGYNKRLDVMQAIVLDEKLKHLDEWNKKRRAAAKVYTTLLDGVGDLDIQPYSEDCSYYVFTLRTGIRDALKDELKKNGIESAVHYPVPMHLQKCFKYLGYKKGDFPMAELHCATVLSIPLYSDIRKLELRKVVSEIISFYG